jgi:plastocyanin
VEIQGADGALTPAAGAIVWLPGATASRAKAPLAMASQDKRFEPHVLAVPRGATVSFTNVDRVYHNVFSLSRPNEFDLGIYRKGASRSKRFESPGVVRVYCNIHPDMAGFVLVVDTNAFAVVEPDGSYRIPGLPPGRHKARVWDERGGERELAVDVAPGGRARLDFVLDASQWKPFRI